MKAISTALITALLLPVALPAQAPEAGTIILPPHHDPARAYPVIVLLPASNGTAQAFLDTYVAPDNAIVVLAAGRGTPDDYRTGDNWTRTIARYEAQLLADLAAIQSQYQVDTTKIVLAGFSMGGDLAWALALRNPTRVSGAVVMSSRASYRARPADMRELAERRAKFMLLMGSAEEYVLTSSP
jgi:pimeloyl-ACP methyl ester carboxylesterase